MSSTVTQINTEIADGTTVEDFIEAQDPSPKLVNNVEKDQASMSQQAQIQKQQMIFNGWCSHQVNHLKNTYNSKAFSYLATLKRSPQRLLGHERCASHTNCVAYNIDKATYVTQHTTEGCTCSTIMTPYEELVRASRRGEIPLVSISDGADTNTTCMLRVHRRSRSSKYIAISHVWADGLGNPKENGLPLCQLKRLKSYFLPIQELFDMEGKDILFWMDTLCIPVRSNEYSLRLMQIDKMASIYKGATTSLVLDVELMSTRMGTFPGLKSLAYLACSVWMSRSWTLQEGILPPFVAVQFQDRAAVWGSYMIGARDRGYIRVTEECIRPDSTHVDKTLQSGNSNDRHNGDRNADVSMEDEIASASQYFGADEEFWKTLYRVFLSKKVEFATIWNELAGRSTTMPDDIPLILANAMDLDNQTLLTYHNDVEMLQAVLLSLGKLSLSIFFHIGPKQSSNPRNRWCPSRIETDMLSYDKELTICSSYLRYNYSPGHSGFVPYLTNSLPMFRLGTLVRFEDEGPIYAVVQLSESMEQMDLNGFDSTCLIVESKSSSERPLERWGACFRLRGAGKVVKASKVDMIYDCPVVLQMVVSDEELKLGRNKAYRLNPPNSKCEFRIAYGLFPTSHDVVSSTNAEEETPPNFKRLSKRRAFHRAWKNGLWFVILVPLFLLIWFLLPAMLIIKTNFGLGAIIGIVAGAVGVLFFTFCIGVELFTMYSTWWYVGSFGAIAAKRQARGTVCV